MFQVPENARNTTHDRLGTTAADGNNGLFMVPSPEPGWVLLTIASDGLGWEHVSVRAIRDKRGSRVPTWKEMAAVKSIFWGPEDVVVQFHPRRSEYVNMHPHVLHLWRPIGVTIPTPDPLMVGVVDHPAVERVPAPTSAGSEV